MPLELIEGLPDAVVGLEAVGEVTADDYERVANLAIERGAQRTRRSGSCSTSSTSDSGATPRPERSGRTRSSA